MQSIQSNGKREIIYSSLVRCVEFNDSFNLFRDEQPLSEGDVVAVEVEDAVGYAVGAGLLASSLVEDRDGALRVLSPGACLITVVGSRESTFWSVANLDARRGSPMQLVSHAGLCSYLISGSAKAINVRVLGRVAQSGGTAVNIKSHSVSLPRAGSARRRRTMVFAGTSAEVGKTTSMLHVMRKLREAQPASSILAIKLSGTPSQAEINLYRSYGATSVLNLVDLGFPSSYTADKRLLLERVDEMIASDMFQAADHVMIELGGDVIGGTNDDLAQLISRRTAATIVLSAFDCFGAEGCVRFLDALGVRVAAISGKCTANSVVKKRTHDLCGVPALSVFDLQDLEQLTGLCMGLENMVAAEGGAAATGLAAKSQGSRTAGRQPA